MKIFFYLFFAFLISACSLQNVPKKPSIYTPAPQTSQTQSEKKQFGNKLAIIIPEKTIKSYSSIVINASLAYILRKEAKINTEIFLIGSEDEANIQKALNEIKAKDIHYIIAAFTTKGANTLSKLVDDEIIYIPTIHKTNTQISNPNIYFGGIDYKAQVAKLMQHAGPKIASFYDNSALSSHINQILTNYGAKLYLADGKKLNYVSLLFSQGSLHNASIFLNSSLTKNAIIASQIRVNNINAQGLFLTQIGYNPILLSLTQPGDRRKMLIANSILNEDLHLSYLNESFEQSIDYNWVAYSTSLGVDFIYTNFIDKKADKLFKEPMKDNQILYDIKLMKALEFGFEEVN